MDPRQTFATPAAPYAIAAAEYSARPPSPPPIIIPAPFAYSAASEPIKVVPSYDNIDPTSLSLDDLQIITQNGKEQIAHDIATTWVYECRRAAQPILDYLYLGPASVARDRQWLRESGITMLMAVRDARWAGMGIMEGDRVAAELGIRAEHIDVSANQGLIREFPSAVKKINNHMLDVYRSQALRPGDGQVPDGQMVIDRANFRRGRVLVYCETGNDRSASIVVAYLMSVMGVDMVRAYQFVNYKRFCVSLNEDLKQLLKTYEDILMAQRAVHQHEMALDDVAPGPGPSAPPSKKAKRGFEETMNCDGEDGVMTDPSAIDQYRFSGRGAFAPFVDSTEMAEEK